MAKLPEVWKSEYELRQFINIAVRWKIDGIYNNRTEDNPFSVFIDDIKSARVNFDNFCFQLRETLTQTENWKAIEIDLKDRFINMGTSKNHF